MHLPCDRSQGLTLPQLPCIYRISFSLMKMESETLMNRTFNEQDSTVTIIKTLKQHRGQFNKRADSSTSVVTSNQLRLTININRSGY